MQRLFVYGTLRFPKYQKEAWGHTYKTSSTQVTGYRRSHLTIAGDKYIVAWPDNRHSIRGVVLEVSARDLKKSDVYENYYSRKRVQLADGSSAWMYHYKGKEKR